MNINALQVNGLFNSFDHDLRFPPNERLMIMIGPNGYGKTMTLRIIDALFNHSASRLVRLPFQRVAVSFDNETALMVERDQQVSSLEDSLPLTISLCEKDKEPVKFSPSKPQIDSRSLDFPISALDDMIPVLDRVGTRQWRNIQTDEILDLEDVLVAFEEELPEIGESITSPIPEWLKDIKANMPVRLIGTERLTKESESHVDLMKYRRHSRPSRWNRSNLTKRTVRAYSEELADFVNQAMDRIWYAFAVFGSYIPCSRCRRQ